jgi:hypothetical protein
MAISTIASRADFIEYCLRKLGKPVIDINVDSTQASDRVDDALKWYWEYHFDGSEKIFYKHQITSDDLTNKYITLPSNIIGAVNIFDIGDYIATNNLFNIRYQIALNDLYTLTYQSMVPYYMAFQQIQLLEGLLVGKQPIRYNRKDNNLYVDVDWTKFYVGSYLIVEAYQVLDPDAVAKVWEDRWLQRYATALIKQQWGSNLTKFTGMQLPGGVQFNGEKIYNDATQEIAKLEDEMINSYSEPPQYMIG